MRRIPSIAARQSRIQGFALLPGGWLICGPRGCLLWTTQLYLVLPSGCCPLPLAALGPSPAGDPPRTLCSSTRPTDERQRRQAQADTYATNCKELAVFLCTRMHSSSVLPSFRPLSKGFDRCRPVGSERPRRKGREGRESFQHAPSNIVLGGQRRRRRTGEAEERRLCTRRGEGDRSSGGTFFSKV
jgi:hypothetical protein